MARAIELDPAAEKELDDAIEFLGSNSVAGRRLATAIDRAFSTLVDFPEAGKQVDGSLRSLCLPGTSYSMITKSSRTRFVSWCSRTRRAALGTGATGSSRSRTSFSSKGW